MRQIASWRFYILQILIVMVCLGLTSCGGGGSTTSTTATALDTTIQLSTSALAFTSQIVNTSSSPQTLTLTNTGTDTLSIDSISASGDFKQANNCGTALAPKTSCTASITFTPTTDGTRSGYVVVRDSGKGNPHKVGLSGTGSAPVATLSQASLTYATQQLNTPSAAQSVTLTNTGTLAMSISSVKTSGDFAQTNNCGSSLAVSASCTINVTFTPTASGSRTGNLSVADDAAGSPHQVSLTGTGAGATARVVSLSSSSLTFGSQTLNVTSSAQTITVSNTGNASLSLTSVTTSGDFSQTNNCGSSLAAGSTCAVQVSFKPTATGTRTGALSVADNATGSPQQVSLTGTGAAATAPVVSLSSSSLTFGSQTLNVTSSAQTITVSNTGNASLSLTSVTTSGDFSQTNNCGSSLAAGSTCSVQVSFKPTATGTRAGTLSIADNATGSPQQVSLTGTGTAATAPVVSLSSSSLTFGSQTLNVTSSAQTITVSNTGNASLSLTSVTTSGDFSQTNNCGSSLAAGSTCAVQVSFKPTATGTRTGALSVADNATGSPQTVSLSGSGVTAGSLVPSAATLSFGTVNVGQSSTQTLSVSNTGGQSVTVSSVGTTGSGVSVSGVTVPFSVAAGQSVSMSVTFAPGSASTVNGSVYFVNNSPSTNVSVAVNGTGAAVQHQVTVQWSAPDSSVAGYYTYRSTVSGGPYTRISSLNSASSYADEAVTSGDTYYYVVTSVDSSNMESAYSNEASATVPLP